MVLQGSELRQVLWSSLCETNLAAYSQYLRSCELVFKYGGKFVEGGGVDGAGGFAFCDCRGVDHVGRTFAARLCDGRDEGVEVVDGGVVAGGVVGTENNGDGYLGKRKVGVGSSRVSVGGSDSGVGGLSDSGVVADIPACGDDGRSSIDAKVDGGSVVGSQALLSESCVPEWRRGDGSGLGRHYLKNKQKREKRKLARGKCAEIGVGSVVGSVDTVSTRTAVEIEAAQTLAARRVAENKVAEALAKHKLRVLSDADRTVMVDRLAAARAEQRINDAKAKSQASFKKCDESLKSLGSSGSAGEFALKQEVKRARDNEQMHAYVKEQLQLALKYVSAEGMQRLAELPPPKFVDEVEAFGGCPSCFDELEQQEYYDSVNRRNEEAYDESISYY